MESIFSFVAEAYEQQDEYTVGEKKRMEAEEKMLQILWADWFSQKMCDVKEEERSVREKQDWQREGGVVVVRQEEEEVKRPRES